MLKTRVITAVLLLITLVPGLFWLPQAAWAAVMAAIAGLAAWEWAGFMQLKAPLRIAVGSVMTVLCLCWLVLAPETLGTAGPAVALPGTLWLIHGIAGAFWTLLVPVWLRANWRLPANALGLVVGLMVILPCWVAIIQLRLLGAWQFLAILVVVWVADIAAYFSGRAFGRHKLAVKISPGKTWEGAIGGGICVLIYGLAMRQIFGLEATPLWLWVLGLLIATAVSVIGDLFESLLKRQVGLKDSSKVLPGHGGVLDRIDSLTSTLPLVALMWLLFSSFPR